MANKIIASLTTAGLVASGGVAAAVTSAPGLAIAQEDTVEAPEVPGPHTNRDGLLQTLLEEGVLDDAEVAAVQEVLEELRATMAEENGVDGSERRVRRPMRAGFRLHQLLEDGIVDAEEIAGLPEDSPILDPDGAFAPYLDDGELSAEELDELKAIRDAEKEERQAERSAAIAAALQTLVTDGTLTDVQVDAIVEALETARQDRPRPVRNRMRAGWQLAELLEDGVIDAAELAELPEGHPLTDLDGPAGDYLDDGQLTSDELEEIRSSFRPFAPTGTDV